MQFPVIGDMISVKNLKECLNQLDDNDYIKPGFDSNLVIIKLEYFPEEKGGRIKDYKCDLMINLFYEEIWKTKRYQEFLEDQRNNKWGN